MVAKLGDLDLLLHELKNCMCNYLNAAKDQYEGYPGCPCRAIVVTGAATWDVCGPGGPEFFQDQSDFMGEDCPCGQLTVAAERIYPYVTSNAVDGTFPTQQTELDGTTTGKCFPPGYAVEINITILRCSSAPEGEAFWVESEIMEKEAWVNSIDLMALLNGVTCCLSESTPTHRRGRRFLIDQVTSLSSDGMCEGAELRVTVDLGNPLCPCPEIDTSPESPEDDIPKPDASNTGPRIAITGETLTSSEAINLAIANGGVLRGRRIAGMLQLSEPEHALKFEDCEIIGGGPYQIGCWQSPSSHTRPPTGEYAVFDHCYIEGNEGSGNSANVIGYDHKLLYCELTKGIDCYKPYGNVEAYGCWMHDTWHPVGAHCDIIQVQNGSDFLIHWNNLEGFNHPNSPEDPSLVNNACLQTGKTLGDLLNWRMNDNWVNGGVITVRGPDNSDGYTMDMKWRRNKHGRDWSVAPITRMNELGADYDDSNIFEDTGEPVNNGW